MFSVCSSSSWECTTELCGRRCSAVGDPHYKTFDGKVYLCFGMNQCVPDFENVSFLLSLVLDVIGVFCLIGMSDFFEGP